MESSQNSIYLNGVTLNHLILIICFLDNAGRVRWEEFPLRANIEEGMQMFAALSYK